MEFLGGPNLKSERAAHVPRAVLSPCLVSSVYLAARNRLRMTSYAVNLNRWPRALPSLHGLCLRPASPTSPSPALCCNTDTQCDHICIFIASIPVLVFFKPPPSLPSSCFFICPAVGQKIIMCRGRQEVTIIIVVLVSEREEFLVQPHLSP